eukprot:GHVN01000711.1.p1 GENE.GHVN01000711.1~~GHVN01000711.1.p1  ORF type:complete len:879 (-),score=117.10 GHVN01000711.1:5584-8220(-)
MDASNGDWQRLDTLFYRRIPCCDMRWSSDGNRLSSNNLVAAAQFGGPIAVVRDERVFQPAAGTGNPELRVFSGCGSLLGQRQWNYSGVVALGWSANESLVSVFREGVIRTFTPFCEEEYFFTIDDRIKSEGGIIHATVSPTRVVVVSGTFHVYTNSSFERQLSSRMGGVGVGFDVMQTPITGSGWALKTAPVAMAIVEAKGVFAVVIATEGGELLAVDENSCRDLDIGQGPCMSIAVSVSSSFISILCGSGILSVYAADDFLRPTAPQRKPLETATIDCSKKPRQMTWVGDDCVALNISLQTPAGGWQHVVFIGGPKNDWIPFRYPKAIFLSSEIDGLRIIANGKSEFLHRVHSSTEAVFSIGSCEPAALLTFTVERLKQGDITAEETLRTSHPSLRRAAEACIEAAGYEWSSEQVIELLEAAVFGRQMAGVNDESASSYVRMVRDCRIVFQLRSSPTEMPLTVNELRWMGFSQLIHNLARRRFHQLAFKICEYVGVGPGHVLVHWAKEKLRTAVSHTDGALGAIILEKLQQCPGISFSAVAQAAAQTGRPNLATMLMEYEPDKRVQVKMLIKLAEIKTATEKAVASGDPDLIFECLNRVAAREQIAADGQRDNSVLLAVVSNAPLAANMYVSMCRQRGQWELLQRYYQRTGMMYQVGWASISQGYSNGEWEHRKSWLAFAAGFFNTPKDKTGKQYEAQAKIAQSLTLDTVHLLELQKSLESKYRLERLGGKRMSGCATLEGMSLIETVRELVVLGDLRQANVLQKQFKIPDKRMTKAKAEGFAHSGNWDEFVKLGQSRGCPIPVEYFIQLCQAHHSTEAAKALIPRVKDSSSRSVWFSHMGLMSEAEANVQRERETQSTGASLFQTLAGAFGGGGGR